MAAYRLRCLGETRICVNDGGDCTPRSRKTRAVLAYVLLNGGAPVGRDRVATLLWGDRAEEQARASVRQALYELRHFSGGSAPLLSVTREHVAANAAAVAIDLDEAESLARGNDVVPLSELLPRQPLALLTDLNDIAPDFDDWLRSERAQRIDRLIALSVAAGQAALNRGEVESVRRLVTALEAFDPLSEPAVRLAIQADSLSGDSTRAFRRYRRFEERLRRDLATHPSAETRALLPRLQTMSPQRPVAAELEKLPAVESLTTEEPRRAAESVSQDVSLVNAVASDMPRLRFKRATLRLPVALACIALAIVAITAGFWLFGKEDFATRSALQSRILQAQELMRDRNEPDLTRARTLLLEAVDLDPNYAPAWATLSIVTMLLSDEPKTYGPIPLAQARSQALHYATVAVNLQPQLATAHAALGLVSMMDEGAIPHYRRAIDFDPQRSEYHRWLGMAYASTGRPYEALEAFRRAAETEPRSAASAEQLIDQLSIMGRENEIEAVVRQFNSASRVPFDRNIVQFMSYHVRGELPQSIALGRELLRQRPGDKRSAFDLARIFAALGDRQSALAIVQPDDVLTRAIISHDVPQIERIARESPGVFWHEELAAARAGELLVASGRGKLLLQLFDARYGELARFNDMAYASIAPAPALIVALREAGRVQEAADLNRLVLHRIRVDLAAGVIPRAWAFEHAQQLALAGDNAGALDELERLMQSRWANLLVEPFVPITDLVAFRRLRSDARMIALQRQLNARVQAARTDLDPI